MIKILKISYLAVLVAILNSCASSYQKINPKTLNYASKNIENNILFEYKYDLLKKKYKKKETKKGVKLIAIKITNNSENDIVFGQDFNLVYENGNIINIIQTDKIFKQIKQSPASYLWYLLLTPMQFNTTTSSNGQVQKSSSTPIGLLIGPGLAGGNMIAASSANKNFKNELLEFDMNGKTIKKGETIYGLVGLTSNNYDSIKIKL